MFQYVRIKILLLFLLLQNLLKINEICQRKTFTPQKMMYNGKQIILWTIYMLETMDLPASIVMQWSSNDVVLWDWLRSVKVLYKSIFCQ